MKELWVEKYRPKTIDGYVFRDNHQKEQVERWVKEGTIPHLLFSGNAGIGKTTLAKLIVKNLDCDYLYINSSDERGIETIRDKVSGFASAASFKSIKIVILDEADFLTIQAQASLRNIIETFSRTTRFIMTCNFVERIIDPLQSRCQVLKIIPPSKTDIAKHIANILDKENTKYELEDIKTIINKSYPDLRKMLNTIQLSTQDNKLTIDQEVLVSSNYMTQVLKELIKPKSNWKEIRQIIANANIQDFEEFYRFLFDHSSEYAPGNEGTIAVLVNEYSYQSNFRIDKEINCMALINQIIKNK